jgi:alpha-galactosidase
MIMYPLSRGLTLFFRGALMAVAVASFSSAQTPTGTPAPMSSPPAEILTPKPAPTPRLTGPKVFGVRPGAPFLFTVTATGDRPMVFSAEGLPTGLQLDSATGRITGSVAAAGTHSITLRAQNALGVAQRPFRIVVGDAIALTPPMGWNSWNSWASNVDRDKVMQSVHALVSTGLINHGWSYVNIDDTWQGARTGPDHALLANKKFSDLKGLVDEIHALGLKAGIYSTPWITSYANYAGGSSDNEDGAWDKATVGGRAFHRIGKFHFMAADAKQYAAWGFDYLKYDWDNQKVEDIKEMSDALRASGRDIVYSLSNSLRLELGPDLVRLAHAWRTTGDIQDVWGRTTTDNYHHGVAEIGFLQDQWAPFSGPGHWIDPDMLVLGRVSVGSAMHPTKLTPDEQYTHISLWCLLAAPLLIGCDMQHVDEFTLSLLTNDEVLDVDQDPLGKQAVRVAGPAFTIPPGGFVPHRSGETSPPPPPAPTTPWENPGGNGLVYARPLEDGSLAVGLFNVGPREETVTVRWKDLGISGEQLVRDLWRQKDQGNFSEKFEAQVRSHGVVLVKIAPAK